MSPTSDHNFDLTEKTGGEMELPITLTMEELEAIAKVCKPPQEWYEQPEEDLFNAPPRLSKTDSGTP